MKDQIDLFAQRGRNRKRDIFFMRILVIILIIINLIIYTQSGDVKLSNFSLYIIIISLLLLLILFTFLVHQIQTWILKRGKDEFFDEELNRINREIMKGPKFQNVLITHDAIIYNSWLGVRLIPVKNIIWMKRHLFKFLILPSCRVWSKEYLVIERAMIGAYHIPMENIDESSLRYLINNSLSDS